MKTTQLKSGDIKRSYHLIDLKGETLGRISTKIATLLIGKHKPEFSTHMDNGDFVVAINAKDIKVTGKKMTDKLYQSHSGYPGGFKELRLEQLMAKDPRKVIEHSVKGMLPKNKHQKPRLHRLKVFVDAQHTYQDHLKTSKVIKEKII